MAFVLTIDLLVRLYFVCSPVYQVMEDDTDFGYPVQTQHLSCLVFTCRRSNRQTSFVLKEFVFGPKLVALVLHLAAVLVFHGYAALPYDDGVLPAQSSTSFTGKAAHVHVHHVTFYPQCYLYNNINSSKTAHPGSSDFAESIKASRNELRWTRRVLSDE